MALIDEIDVPELFIQYYSPAYITRCENSMAICRRYYEKLQESAYTIANYIVSYEHAIESLEFSNRQLDFTKNETDKIGKDKHLTPIIKTMVKNKENNTEIINILEERNDTLKKILDKINDYTEQIVRKNNIIDENRRANESLRYQGWGAS